MIASDIGSPIGKEVALARSVLGVLRSKRSSRKDMESALNQMVQKIISTDRRHSKKVVFTLASTYRQLLEEITLAAFAPARNGFTTFQILGIPVVVVDPLWYKQGKIKFDDIIWAL